MPGRPGEERKSVLRLDGEPVMVEATVDTRDAFCEMLGECIEAAFSSIGESAKIAIYTHLKNVFGIEKHQIPYRIDDFSDALEKIFGAGARNLEILFIKNIQAKAKIEYNWGSHESSSSEFTFKEFIRVLKQNYNREENHQRTESRNVPEEKRNTTSVDTQKTDEDKITIKTVNVMIKKVITIDENDSAKQAADRMNQFEIGSVISTRAGKPIGIVTERDLLKRIISEGKSAKRTRVKEIMTSPLIVISPETDLEEAARLMFEMKIKKLPVVDQNNLVGLVSLTDIARVQPMIKFLQKLSATQKTPKSMQKVLNCYIV